MEVLSWPARANSITTPGETPHDKNELFNYQGVIIPEFNFKKCLFVSLSISIFSKKINVIFK